MRLLIPVVAVAIAAVMLVTWLIHQHKPTVNAYLSIIPDATVSAELRPIIQRMGSFDSAERAQAVLELQQRAPATPDAIRYLVILLKDRTPIRVERNSDGAELGVVNNGGVGYFTCPGALAARVLASSGDSGSQALLDALFDTDGDVRRSAIDGAGYTDHARVISKLVRLLSSTNSRELEVTQASLQRIGAPAIDELTRALRGDDQHVRCAAAMVLARENSVRATSALLAALNNESAETRAAAEIGLSNLQPPECLAALTCCLGDESLRPQALKTLVNIEHPQKTMALLAALQDKDYHLRAGAACALGQITDPAALPALQIAQNDESPEVRERASEAFTAIRERNSRK